MSKRSLSNLADIIGSVSKKHKDELKEETQEISVQKLKAEDKKISTTNIEHTAEFSVTELKGLTIQSRKAKVPESFKIKPSLKGIVAEIVEEARSNGQKISKGELYNLLIAKGLESLN